MRNRTLGLAIAATLSACGGGGDPESGAPPSATENYELKAQVAGLAGTADIADGHGGEVAVSSDGEHLIATLQAGTPYTARVARQPDSQVCLIDKSDDVIGGDARIHVDCADGAGLTLGTNTYAVSQVVLVDVPGNPDAISATIDGTPVEVNAYSGAFAFVMPEVSPGTHTLVVQAHGRAFSKELNVTPNPLSEPAAVYLDRRATEALGALDALLASSGLSEEERALAIELKARLQSELAGIAGLPADDALRYARALAANEGLPADALLKSMQIKAAGCFTHAKVFASGVVFLASGISLAGASVASGPGIALFMSVSVASALTGAVTVREGLRGVMETCFDAKKLEVDSNDSLWLGMGDPARSLRAAKAVSGDTDSRMFTHNAARRVTPAIVMRLSTEVSAGVLRHAHSLPLQYQRLRLLASGIVQLPAIPLLDSIGALKREALHKADPSELEILTSKPGIAAIAAAHGSQLSMTFRFTSEPMPTEPVPFGFRLRHTRLGIKSDAVWASLRPVGDTALGNLQVKVYKDGAHRSLLSDGDFSTYDLTAAPGNGTVELASENRRQYVYAPHAGFVGIDSFGYVGIDHQGRSLPGTVQVEVAENCRPEITPGTKSLVCRYSVPKELSFHAAPSESALAGEFIAAGPWIFNGGADYVGYYENSSPAADKADLAPSGTAVRTHAYRVDHDAANDRFEVSGSGGTYDSVSGARIGRTNTDWSRGLIRRHRNGTDYLYERATVAYGWTESWEGRTVMTNIVLRDYTLAGYRSDGTPAYAGQTTMCSIYPLPGEGIFTTRTLVSIYSVDDLASPVLQNEYEGSCPVTETVLSAVAQEARPAELRLDWRTGAPR